MILTKEIFYEGISSRGGWNSKQVAVLGESMKVGGWVGRVIGKDYPEETINQFLKLKDAHLSKKTESKFVPVSTKLSHKEQIKHPNWQRKRLKILERDGFKCMVCGNKEKILNVHHNTYNKDYIWSVPDNYLITLCEDCHELFSIQYKKLILPIGGQV